MKFRTLTGALLLIAAISPLHSQPNFPENGPVYNDQSIPKIYITIDPDSLAMIYNNVESDHEYPARFVFQNGAVQDTVDSIGFRLRGNTSRYSAKKSFKVSFNTFFPGRKYHGFEKLNLNGEHNDPTITRAKISWNIFRETLVPASRSNHVDVYINQAYYGLYISVEHIDENFVESRYGSNDGNLYKCLWPADLTYRGSDPNNYKFMIGNRRTYELITNTEQDDYSDLAHFITVLTQTSNANFPAAIQKVFNVNNYLRALAVEVLTGHWDNIWFNKNNFYLYHNTETGLFEYIPYDLDNTYGIWWDGIYPGMNWGYRSPYSWGHPDEERPLPDRLLEFPLFRNRYTFYLKEILDNAFSPGVLHPPVDAIHTMITPSAEADSFRTLDYGYTITDFHNSYTQPLGGHVPYGLKPYIDVRSSSALGQLILQNAAPIISYPKLLPRYPAPGDVVSVTALVEDENIAAANVMLHYRLNNGSWQTAVMKDDGQSNDGAAGDQFYGALLPALGANQTLDYYISASDNQGAVNQTPYDAPASFYTITTPGTQPALFINEFMASNSTVIADPFGEYDDWIEIYNDDAQAVWLGDKYLSDNLANPDKWQLPDYTLAPGEFVLIWADDDSSQGPFHTTYKLAQEGEQIGIFSADLTVIDSLSYGPQTTDVSYGRVSDGSPEWQFFTSPTPGSSNGASTIDDPPLHLSGTFELQQNYPNPFNGETTIPFFLPAAAEVTLTVYNVLGQEIAIITRQQYAAGQHYLKWHAGNNGREVGSGIYFLQMTARTGSDREIRLPAQKALYMK